MALLTGDEIIEIAIRLEERGESYYSAAAKTATTGEIKALFEDLANQEQYHRQAFQKMGRDVVQATLSDDQWEQFEDYTGALLEQRIFDKPEGAVARAAIVQDEKEALGAAVGFEEETLGFFRELREVVRGSEQRTVDRIIAEEEEHIRRLSGMLSAA